MRTVLALALAALALPAGAAAQQAIAIASGGGRSVATMTVPFGRSAQFNQLHLRPVQVIEDSRCPRMVTCVWRGRLKVQFKVNRGQPLILEDNKPVAIRGGTLTLLGASPISQRGEKVPQNAYLFKLRYER